MKACYSSLFEQDFISTTGETERINRIVVPKIQRSYAQGRKSEVYVRNTFLTDIFVHLVEGKTMDLNFIYGAVRKLENSLVFELIDGQQRITTLFLLHWYIANRELEHDSEEYKDITRKLALFSYETRVTSSDFCQMLASFRGDISVLYPSKVLKLSKWYFKAYDKDATVEGMLNMLDAIHEKYEKELYANHDLALYNNLQLLQFQVLSLGEFGLTEELYIKMNSRGLPLSSFDNFKAELTGYLGNIPIGKEAVPLTSSYTGDPVQFSVVFSTNLDANWINVFWSKEDPEFDTKYFKFFHIYLGYKYLLEPANPSSDMRKDSIVKFFLSEENYSEKYRGFSQYRSILDLHPEYFRSISKVLSTLSDKYRSEIIPNVNASWSTSPIEGFFNKTTHNVNLAFFATTEFIEAYRSFDLTTYKQWMRVAWNIIENSETDNFMNIAGVARNLSRIIRYTASCEGYSFYEALALYGDEDHAKLASKSIREEVIKATRIAEDIEWESIFQSVEKHPFLKGTTSFFYTDGISKEAFRHRIEIINEMFTEGGASVMCKAEGHILLRALIGRIGSWGDIMDKYLTDKSETQSFFKHWLINTSSVHEFICELTDCPDMTTIMEKLRMSVAMDSSLTDQQQKRIHRSLYQNPNLQTWLQNNEAIRLRYFMDNIYMMKRYSSIYKVMLDTDRNRFVPEIIDKYYYQYQDEGQKNFWNNTQYYYGNELIIVKQTSEAEVTITFTTESRYIIDVRPGSVYKKQKFLDRFGVDENSITDGLIRIVDNGRYDTPNAYQDIKTNYLDIIEEVINE